MMELIVLIISFISLILVLLIFLSQIDNNESFCDECNKITKHDNKGCINCQIRKNIKKWNKEY